MRCNDLPPQMVLEGLKYGQKEQQYVISNLDKFRFGVEIELQFPEGVGDITTPINFTEGEGRKALVELLSIGKDDALLPLFNSEVPLSDLKGLGRHASRTEKVLDKQEDFLKELMERIEAIVSVYDKQDPTNEAKEFIDYLVDHQDDLAYMEYFYRMLMKVDLRTITEPLIFQVVVPFGINPGNEVDIVDKYFAWIENASGSLKKLLVLATNGPMIGDEHIQNDEFAAKHILFSPAEYHTVSFIINQFIKLLKLIDEGNAEASEHAQSFLTSGNEENLIRVAGYVIHNKAPDRTKSGDGDIEELLDELSESESLIYYSMTSIVADLKFYDEYREELKPLNSVFMPTPDLDADQIKNVLEAEEYLATLPNGHMFKMEKEHDRQIEIINKEPATGRDILKLMKATKIIVDSFISKGMVASSISGMHMSISYKGNSDDFQTLKFIMLSDAFKHVIPEEHRRAMVVDLRTILDGYASEMLESLYDRDAIDPTVVYDLASKALDARIKNDSAKYRSINFRDFSLHNGRIELRWPGGEGYDKRIDEYFNIALKSMFVLEVAYDSEAYHKEYLKTFMQEINNSFNRTFGMDLPDCIRQARLSMKEFERNGINSRFVQYTFYKGNVKVSYNDIQFEVNIKDLYKETVKRLK